MKIHTTLKKKTFLDTEEKQQQNSTRFKSLLKAGTMNLKIKK